MDGLLEGQAAQTLTPYANTTDLQIGSMLNVPIDNSLNGTIDELKLYNAALSASQIAIDGHAAPEPTALTLLLAGLAGLRQGHRKQGRT